MLFDEMIIFPSVDYTPKVNNSVQLRKKYFQKSTSNICIAVQSFNEIEVLRIEI
jgi:hypothetical protein